MTQAFDDRIVRLGIEVNGDVKTYDESFFIIAYGVKYATAIMGECQARIDNIDKTTRDYLLTQTSPFNLNRTAKKLTLDVGRQSYGTFRMFEGNIIACNPSQPPDIGVGFKSLTLSFMLGNIIARTEPENTNMRTIAQHIATDLGVALDFQATDKQINNYQFTGAALKQVQILCDAGNVDAFIDNDKLVVKDRNAGRNGSAILISKATGMVGVPEVTEQGVRVRVLIRNEIRIGDSITIESDVNPAANGTFVIYKLIFEIASRDTPFYWIIEATKFLI